MLAGGLSVPERRASAPRSCCGVCERLDCPQRAAVPLGHPLRIGPNARSLVPCPVAHAAVEKPHRS
ncbi:short-chain fatty acyl-CoA regulator family protein [Streptomyces mirabilis]|uniref:short-chain fatty acyl-CoA regulator family protein n=1 Tax=Streptomyces mirabilis TaxID=68239 RepID=UPI00369BFD17